MLVIAVLASSIVASMAFWNASVGGVGGELL